MQPNFRPIVGPLLKGKRPLIGLFSRCARISLANHGVCSRQRSAKSICSFVFESSPLVLSENSQVFFFGGEPGNENPDFFDLAYPVKYPMDGNSFLTPDWTYMLGERHSS